jgi:hypothetical protein
MICVMNNYHLYIIAYENNHLIHTDTPWSDIYKGRLVITTFPVPYAGGRHLQFSLRLMPGLVKNHDEVTHLVKTDAIDPTIQYEPHSRFERLLDRSDLERRLGKLTDLLQEGGTTITTDPRPGASPCSS